MHLFIRLFGLFRAIRGVQQWVEGGCYMPRYLHIVAACVTLLWGFCVWELAPPRGYNIDDVPLVIFLLALAPLAIYAIYIAQGGDTPKPDASALDDIEAANADESN